jgi:1D-myo-inositol-triphosphate 3-kinase
MSCCCPWPRRTPPEALLPSGVPLSQRPPGTEEEEEEEEDGDQLSPVMSMAPSKSMSPPDRQSKIGRALSSLANKSYQSGLHAGKTMVDVSAYVVQTTGEVVLEGGSIVVEAGGQVVGFVAKGGKASIGAMRDAGAKLRDLGEHWIERLGELSLETRAVVGASATRVQAFHRGTKARSRLRLEREAAESGSGSAAPPAALACQAGGHADAFKRVGGGCTDILKETSERERDVYEGMQADPISKHAPAYGGCVARGGSIKDGYTSIRLADLTAGCTRPCVMDIKMGIRTFLESEVKSDKRRVDLAEKMAKQGGEMSEEEKEKGITKLRYMQFREQTSSTATLGWRLEAIVLPSTDPEAPDAAPTKIDCKKLSEEAEIIDAIAKFLGGKRDAGEAVHKLLLELRADLEASAFFQAHEFIGSSLLFVYDADGAGAADGAAVKMIDFAKTQPVAAEKLEGYTHRQPWVCGNQEDGYLFGLDSLVDCWGKLLSTEADSPYLGVLESKESQEDKRQRVLARMAGVS